MRHGDWVEANVRAKRLCADAFVTYTAERQLSQRWCVWERMTVPLTTDEDLLATPGMTQETEAVVCAAATQLEALHKYSLIKTQQRADDAARESGGTPKTDYRMLFRDRVLRGEQSMPPPDPPEWAEYRKMQAATAKQAGERTGEQIKATVRNFMALQGFDLNTAAKRALGIGRGANWSKR